MLDQLFGHFDTLAERYGLEKIKTIGDCYMVAAGVPTPRPDHARALALMALDMLEAVRSKRRASATSASSCASASTPARWWRASSAASGSSTTCGATP